MTNMHQCRATVIPIDNEPKDTDALKTFVEVKTQEDYIEISIIFAFDK